MRSILSLTITASCPARSPSRWELFWLKTSILLSVKAPTTVVLVSGLYLTNKAEPRIPALALGVVTPVIPLPGGISNNAVPLDKLKVRVLGKN